MKLREKGQMLKYSYANCLGINSFTTYFIQSVGAQ